MISHLLFIFMLLLSSPLVWARVCWSMISTFVAVVSISTRALHDFKRNTSYWPIAIYTRSDVVENWNRPSAWTDWLRLVCFSLKQGLYTVVVIVPALHFISIRDYSTPYALRHRFIFLQLLECRVQRPVRICNQSVYGMHACIVLILRWNDSYMEMKLASCSHLDCKALYTACETVLQCRHV